MFYGISYKDIISEAKSYFINGYMAILLLHYSMMSFILWRDSSVGRAV